MEFLGKRYLKEYYTDNTRHEFTELIMSSDTLAAAMMAQLNHPFGIDFYGLQQMLKVGFSNGLVSLSIVSDTSRHL
jgi:hypothetical protein